MKDKRPVMPITFLQLELLRKNQEKTNKAIRAQTLFLLKTLITSKNIQVIQLNDLTSHEPAYRELIEKPYKGKFERYKTTRKAPKDLGLGKTHIVFDLSFIDKEIKNEYRRLFKKEKSIEKEMPNFVAIEDYSLINIPTDSKTQTYYAMVAPKIIGKGAQGKVRRVMAMVVVNADNTISIKEDTPYILKTGEVLLEHPNSEREIYYLLRQPHFVNETDFRYDMLYRLAQLNKIVYLTRLDVAGEFVKLYRVFRDKLANPKTCKVRHLELYYPGIPLSDLIYNSDTVLYSNSEEALAILKETASDLHEDFHEQSIVHHDFKPGNMLFFEKRNIDNRRVKIVDKGLCQYIKEPILDLVGTKLYAPPELTLDPEAKENYIVGTTTDVYSFGVFATQLFFQGKIPRSQCNYLSLREADYISHGVVPIDLIKSDNPITGTDYIHNFLLKCLDENLETRLANAAAVLHELDELGKMLKSLATKKSETMELTASSSRLFPYASPTHQTDNLTQSSVNSHETAHYSSTGL